MTPPFDLKEKVNIGSSSRSRYDTDEDASGSGPGSGPGSPTGEVGIEGLGGGILPVGAGVGSGVVEAEEVVMSVQDSEN